MARYTNKSDLPLLTQCLKRCDGAVWSETRPTSSLLLGVWGSAPTDVFVAGTRGVILHGTP